MKYTIKSARCVVPYGRDPWVVMQRIIDIIPDDEKDIHPFLASVEYHLDAFSYAYKYMEISVRHGKGLVDTRWESLAHACHGLFLNRSGPWIRTAIKIFMAKTRR